MEIIDSMLFVERSGRAKVGGTPKTQHGQRLGHTLAQRRRRTEHMYVLSEYGCGTAGTVAGPVSIENKDPTLSAKDIRGILQAAIDNGTIPEPDSSFCVQVVLDDRTRVTTR
jgi:hypothetical protein